MNAALPAEMVEATRLTRAGQLTEATALLQRVLRGGTVPDTSPPGDTAPAGGGVRVVELTPDTSELTERPLMPPAAQPAAASATGRSAGTRERSPPPAPPRCLLARVGRGPAEPAIGGPLARRPPRTADLLPDGGRFLAAAHRNQAGSRDYKLYVPSGYCGQAVPLVVMLHGCTQSPDDFAAGTRMNLLAEERTCLVAYPAQATAANPSRCWNWYSPGHQQRGRGEPSLLAGITRQILRDYAVDPARAYVAGLSAGAAAAAIMGTSYPDLYAAVGVHSGLACGLASDLPSAFAAMRQGEEVAGPVASSAAGAPGRRRLIPTIVFHGDRDTTVHPRNGDRVIAQSSATTLGELRTTVQHGRVPGGHAYSRTLHVDAHGRTVLEQWVVHGAGHAWSGGSPAGSYTDPRGPAAAREMLRFFLEHRHPRAEGLP